MKKLSFVKRFVNFVNFTPLILREVIQHKNKNSKYQRGHSFIFVWVDGYPANYCSLVIVAFQYTSMGQPAIGTGREESEVLLLSLKAVASGGG